MNSRTTRLWMGLGAAIVAVFIGYQLWLWEVEAIEVKPGTSLVRVHLWGKPLDHGEIIAPDASHQGIQLEMLAEGRHFINPWLYERIRVDMIDVPAGQCAVLTRKFGTPITPERLSKGEVIAGENERGIVREVLLPGKHRINPYAYDHKLVPAVSISDAEVGVRTLKDGKDPSGLKRELIDHGYVVPPGYRGVQQELRPPGTYYINPYVEDIVPVMVREQRVEFSDIEFPSRDGFNLRPRIQVTYRVRPETAPQLFVMLTERGALHQKATTQVEQSDNEILRKIVLPLIRGYARIEGSKFEARDFIAAPTTSGETSNARERLRKNLEDKLRERCAESGIVVMSLGFTDQMSPPAELAQQIYERKEAVTKRETNLSRIAALKTEQELKATEALKQQAQEKVEAQTRLIQAETKATQRKQVEESKLARDLSNAQLMLDASRETAKAVLTNGKADADVIEKQNEAEVAGLKRAIQGFSGPDAYAQFQVIAKLAPALTEIFASDSSDFAKLFSGLMTPNKPTPAPVAGTPANGASGNQ